jgi:hypothetical protein
MMWEEDIIILRASISPTSIGNDHRSWDDELYFAYNIPPILSGLICERPVDTSFNQEEPSSRPPHERHVQISPRSELSFLKQKPWCIVQRRHGLTDPQLLNIQSIFPQGDFYQTSSLMLGPYFMLFIVGFCKVTNIHRASISF